MPARAAKNVFINCPYDAEYVPTLRPMLFAVLVLGFTPRLAMESGDSGATRIQRIIKLIRNSRYAIHDLSRLQAGRPRELFRLNMSFELGLDIGCRLFGVERMKRKKCLVLEARRHSIKAALSDFAGFDACSHNDEPESGVRHVRNWLVQEAGATGPSGTAIWYAFNDFVADLAKDLRRRGFRTVDFATMPLQELLRHMSRWIRNRPDLR